MIEDDMESPLKDKYLNFDEYIEVMKEKMMVEQSKMKDVDIIFESQSSNVSCLFWPY